MWSRRRLDIAWSDLAVGLMRVCFAPDAATAAARVERRWPDPRHTLACLSVRSGFDLLLGALDLPNGSEVLVSAVTIPDMVRIIEHHGLVPVPVDLDPKTMAPTLDGWRRAITPATRLMLAAHLFGGRTDLGPVISLARRHGLMVIEDCAQAFAGTGCAGHQDADASMFSFGTIKSATALGGAVLRVRDDELLARMRTRQAAYPMQRRAAYLKRLLRCSALKTLASRPVCSLLVRGCRAMGRDYDRWINHAARGFPGDDFFSAIRQRPCASLLAMLDRRLCRYDGRRIEHQAEKGRALRAMLEETISCPGTAAAPHTYWAFAVVTEEPRRLIDRLARAGFDATQGNSLCVVAPPAHRPDQRAVVAEELLRHIVFLPFYPEMPARAAERMTAVIRAAAANDLPTLAVPFLR